MRWATFGLVLYVVMVLHTAAAPFVAVNGIRPNLLAILAVYVALAARSQDALLACWVVGMATDLCSQSYRGHGNVGVNALALGLVGLGIVKVREYTFRDSVVTHLVFTFGATLLLSMAVGAHLCWVRDDWDPFGRAVAASIYAAIYTGVLAPYGHWCLHKLRGLMGIGTSHRLRVQ